MTNNLDGLGEIILSRLNKLSDSVAALTPTVPKALTLQEVADCLGLSIDTVRRLCDRREIRYIQQAPNAAKRVLLTDLNAWIEKHSVNPA